MPSTNPRSGFSLIELLTVMAILSVLAGLAASSVYYTGAANLTAAGNSISDTIVQARQNSISRDAFTAVVVKTSGAGAYTNYCLMQLTRDPVSGSFTGSTWQPLTAWRHLNNGAVFDPGVSVSGSTSFFTANGSLVGAQSALSYQGQPINLANSAIFQVFGPDGSMAETQPMRLRIVSGTWNGATVSYQGQMNGAVPANYYDIVFLQNSGLTKIELP